MRNVATNVYAKSRPNYAGLHIDKTLGFRKSDNNNKQRNNKKSKNNVCSDG